MRKTEYISHEFNRFGVSADRQETEVYWSPIAIVDEELVCDQRVWADYCNELFQVGNKIKKIEGELYRDRETRIRAIEKTCPGRLQRPILADFNVRFHSSFPGKIWCLLLP